MAFGNWRKYNGNPNNTPFDNSASRFGESRQENGGIDQIKVSTPDLIMKRFGIFEKVSSINKNASGVTTGVCCTDEYIVMPTSMTPGGTYTLTVGNAKSNCLSFYRWRLGETSGSLSTAATDIAKTTSGSNGQLSTLVGATVRYTAPQGTSCNYNTNIALYCGTSLKDGYNVGYPRCPLDGDILGWKDPTHKIRSSNSINFSEQQIVYVSSTAGTSFLQCGGIGNGVMWFDASASHPDVQYFPDYITFTGWNQWATMRLSCCEYDGTGAARAYHPSSKSWDSSSGTAGTGTTCGEGYTLINFGRGVFDTIIPTVCPPPSKYPVISYASRIMNGGESQYLSAIPSGGSLYSYKWEVEGGGYFETPTGPATETNGDTVLYVSPPEDLSCPMPKVTISCKGDVYDTVYFCVNFYMDHEKAYSVESVGVIFCNATWSPYGWYFTNVIDYDCGGNILKTYTRMGCFGAKVTGMGGCGGGSPTIPCDALPITTDFRTEEMKLKCCRNYCPETP